ncbi:1,6-anhydro-N-acetylmuramyl-L-alanine amidase AmpD [Herbaspirillum sp. LeCh32-8]|uniref:1,6-anhydro-N-acetylmuramyl-L-alanine amidase AmpD n=1 Tax=Herbaspirillum sp. LeCh32-8 TaxID=2821356 RepID=UPI001AE6B22F|nr:1,6-anhydro-N-acetylmuramyl-L-alanine amidase AmpD [Herbaspirillum sp. LeCh32-8]MBP0598473.1 1,6-anhydro-N-acetylmuramyl-L-alanine amidase AmpD [Herbaspirillum sp. LeCh32-8]
MSQSATDAGAWFIDGDGWCSAARREPSPNCDERPDGCITDLLVVHNISLPPGVFGGPYIADLFCNRLDYEVDPYFDQLRPLRVSAHFLIRRDGEVVQFVSANRRAWHAGVSVFDGRERCNDFSIGIELEGTDFEPFAEAQYSALARLTSALVERYALTDVAGHEHIAPVRKTDPGPFFDWRRYRHEFAKIINGAQLRFPSGLPESQAATGEKFEK